MSSTGRSPQPPLLFLGCLLLGAGLGFIHPLALGLPVAIRLSLGALLLLLAAIHGGWGLLTFKRMGTTPEAQRRGHGSPDFRAFPMDPEPALPGPCDPARRLRGPAGFRLDAVPGHRC